jgi:hypothetical protein
VEPTGLSAWLSFRQVLGQSKAAIKVALFSIDIRRTLPEDHNKHSLKWYIFWGKPHPLGLNWFLREGPFFVVEQIDA